jgi:hypothetical protein
VEFDIEEFLWYKKVSIMVGQHQEAKGFEFSHYFRHANKGFIDKFINLTEEILGERLVFWPYQEILREGYEIGDLVITAWKSKEQNIRIIIAEDQSYKYGSKFIALCCCPISDKTWLDEVFDKIDDRFKKLTASREQKISDQQTIAWVKRNRFLLILLGFTTLGGGSIFVKFSNIISRPQNILDLGLITLSKIVLIIMLISAVCFMLVFCFRLIRVILKR